MSSNYTPPVLELTNDQSYEGYGLRDATEVDASYGSRFDGINLVWRE